MSASRGRPKSAAQPGVPAPPGVAGAPGVPAPPGVPSSSAVPTPVMPPPPRFPRPAKRPTRRTALSVEAIVAASIEVLDEEGVVGLSMRRVADRLGTGAASLYAHVTGKDELLELVYDELVGQVPLPDPDPKIWREQLRTMMRDFRAILIAHRDAALAGLGRIPTTPHALVAADTVVAVLKAGGLADRVVALGLDQLILYVSADAFETGLMEHGGLSPEDVERYYEDIHAFYERLPADRFPALASVAEEMTGPDGDERFEFGLDVLIAGFEALSAASR